MAIPEAIAVLDIVTCLTAPITHLAIVLAPCMDGLITDCGLGSAASLALKVRGLVHVAVNAATNAGYGISSGKAVRALIHGQAFVLEGLFQGSDALGDLASFGVVGTEILDFTLQSGVVLGFQGPVHQVSKLRSLSQ